MFLQRFSRSILSIQSFIYYSYTWQVLEETLRISVTATFAVRVSNDKELTIGGHLIPAGTPMVLPLGVLLSDEQYFPNIDKQVFSDDSV